jgi:hypothetical protein
MDYEAIINRPEEDPGDRADREHDRYNDERIEETP